MASQYVTMTKGELEQLLEKVAKKAVDNYRMSNQGVYGGLSKKESFFDVVTKSTGNADED